MSEGESLQISFQILFLHIWSCLKLYLIGVYALLKELAEKTVVPVFEDTSDGLVAIVTGGASGIGYQVTRKLALKNVHVFIAGRSKQEADEAIAKIRAELSTVRVQFLHLDLASLTSVRSFVENFQHTGLPLHILINNAGVMLVPYSETEDGLETHFQVNYLSHLYLTSLLLNKLKASGKPDRCAHIINVSSVVHWVADATDIQPSHTSISSYSPHSAYASSKLAVIMSTYILSQLLKGDNSNVTANCLHPGVVNTNLYDNIHWSVRWVMDIMRHLFFKNAIEAANSVVFLALSPLVESHTGGYYDNCKVSQSKHCTYSKTCQYNLEKMSCELLGIQSFSQTS
ncbi:dehydrogenase/reductase SDR family member on chromosome X-like [Haliotis rubra]|uniref:dehydrogenase/reductase SDR family member on chromosome X-like n=1 Tax=Haliotis rubra TaxID=36100 RepID=UPI001EE62A6F|nr:dehydrogenase/reductase SDR family member on chromosome X-like [Haliotis rubra]